MRARRRRTKPHTCQKERDSTEANNLKEKAQKRLITRNGLRSRSWADRFRSGFECVQKRWRLMGMTLDVKDVRTTRYADMSRRPMDLGFVLGEKRITNNHIQPLKRCNPKRSVHEEIAEATRARMYCVQVVGSEPTPCSQMGNLSACRRCGRQSAKPGSCFSQPTNHIRTSDYGVTHSRCGLTVH